MEEKLNSISQELALFQLQYFQWKNEIDRRSSDPASFAELVANLENRVKILETARQDQIILNSTFVTKTQPTVKSETFKFWPWK